MRVHLFAVGAYLALTAAYTWPLVARLNTAVPQDLGDPLLSVWTLWWNAQVTPFTDRWWDGMAFFPSGRTLTFSDHRVGLSLVATPLMWLGASPLTAHNLVFLLTFFLSAVAAYALGMVLTRSPAASFLGGLIFGFNPFRAGHLAHLELLASYWLPVVFVALHQWLVKRQRRWLALLAAALLMQALTSGYYFFYGAVLVALWLVWFARGLALRDYLQLALAGLAPLVVLTPVLLEYRRAHLAMGLARSINEIETLSADVIGLVTAPGSLWLWRSPDAWHRPEGALLPGLTAVILIALGVTLSARRRPTGGSPAMRAVRAFLLVGAVGVVSAALVAMLTGPVAFTLAGLRLSITDAYKPMAAGMLLLTGWLLTSGPVRAAWQARSPVAFYVLATAAMWILAMGPTVRFLGERVIYKAPYAWLMLLPGFRDEFRAPARFAMLAVLTLAMAAALAFARLVTTAPRGRLAAATVVAGVAIVAESWIEPLPLPAPPAPLTIPSQVPPGAAILEWPLGHDEASAMYRSIAHGRRIVNGMSGYAPSHRQALQAALAEGRVDALAPLAAYAPIAIFVPRAESAAAAPLLTQGGVASLVGSTDAHDVWLVSTSAQASHEPGEGAAVAPVRITDIDGGELGMVHDDNEATAWLSSGPQQGGEQVTADLGASRVIDSVTLSLGQRAWAFPRDLVIASSRDGVTWAPVWSGQTAAATVAAALADPRRVPVHFEFAAHPARFIRLTQAGQSVLPWAIAEVAVRTSAAPSEPGLEGPDGLH